MTKEARNPTLWGGTSGLYGLYEGGSTPPGLYTYLITLSDEKSGTMLKKALKTGFVDNEGQSGPLSLLSKTSGKCQLSVS